MSSPTVSRRTFSTATSSSSSSSSSSSQAQSPAQKIHIQEKTTIQHLNGRLSDVLSAMEKNEISKQSANGLRSLFEERMAALEAEFENARAKFKSDLLAAKEESMQERRRAELARRDYEARLEKHAQDAKRLEAALARNSMLEARNSELQSKVNSLEETLRDLRLQVDSSLPRQAELEAKRLQDENDYLKTKLREAESTISALQADFDQRQRIFYDEMSTLKTALRFGEEERHRIESELRRLHDEQLADLEARYKAELEAERDRLQGLLEEKETIYREEREEIYTLNVSPLNDTIRQLEGELASARSALHEAEIKISSHDSVKLAMEDRLKDLHETLLRVQKQADDAQIEADKMRGPIYTERVALQRHIKELFEGEIAQMRERIAGLEEELKRVTKQRNDLIVERNSLEQKLKTSEETSRREIYALTGERDRAQSEEKRLRSRLAEAESDLGRLVIECELLRGERERFAVQLKRYALLIDGALHGVGVSLFKDGAGASSSKITTTTTSSSSSTRN